MTQTDKKLVMRPSDTKKIVKGRKQQFNLKKINKFCNGPTLFAFHFRHLKLKLTVKDQIDRQNHT